VITSLAFHGNTGSIHVGWYASGITVDKNRGMLMLIFLLSVRQKSKVVAVLNYATRHEDMWGSGGIGPPFFTSALDTESKITSWPCHSSGG
jgi:hypothetical protein